MQAKQQTAEPGGPGALQRFAELRARGAAAGANLLSDPALPRSRWAGARAGGDSRVRWASDGEEFKGVEVVKRDAPVAGEGPGGETIPTESLVCGAYLEMKDVGACHLLERNAKLAARRSLLVLKVDGGVEALEEWRCLRVIRNALTCGQRVMVPRDALAASFGTAILSASLRMPTRRSRPHETCAGTKQRAHRWKDGSELPKVRVIGSLLSRP